jgi:hypothetical protein
MKPSEINALIRELKKNRENMIPKCKLENLSKISNIYSIVGDYVDHLDIDGTWESGYNGDLPGRIYSLPADFPEVPEVTEGWVVVTVGDDGLVCVSGCKANWYSWRSVLVDRPPLTHFGGYLWESRMYPGKFLLTLDTIGLSERNCLSTDPMNWVKPLTPKALRFWSTDVSKACTLGFKPWNADEWPKV